MSNQESAGSKDLQLYYCQYELRKWRDVARKHLPPTECERDDAAAIDAMLTKLEAELEIARHKAEEDESSYIGKLEAENQRLRDALEKIANTDTSYAATAGTAYTMREIAKQTLEEVSDESR